MGQNNGKKENAFCFCFVVLPYLCLAGIEKKKKIYIYIYIFLCLVCIKNEAKEIIIYVNDFYAPIIFKSNFQSTQQKLY